MAHGFLHQQCYEEKHLTPYPKISSVTRELITTVRSESTVGKEERCLVRKTEKFGGAKHAMPRFDKETR
ncbi:hypothetical protein WN48_10706 [Eufriesea mexicana]|uniref:Uncharacterized protein n=1 Tax=Eufriesea mexicana TaxID=516756 RepID=A0A310SLB7_9HYME|nr:hypothetical protein WN48_10706 [Eufriesea mexicana]